MSDLITSAKRSLYRLKTSQKFADSKAIPLTDNDLEFGKLRTIIYVRPRKLFTANVSIIRGDIGPLTKAKFAEVQETIVKIIKTGS
jgi:hypothetical protein